MRRLPIVRHRTATQARAAYRRCRRAVEKTRWHAVWLLLRADPPRTPAQVGDLVGLSAVAVRQVVRRWNARGPDGLTDGRRGNGAAGKLDRRRRASLVSAIRRRPPDGGLWTGPKVAAYVRHRWGVRVCPQTGWDWLRQLGFTLQVPRPSHPRAADRPAQQRWKKTCGGGCDG